MDFPQWYTVDDVAKITGLTTRTIRNYIKDGKLQGQKVGAQWRFTKQNVLDLFEAQGVSDSMEEARNQIVLDFLSDNQKTKPEICTIVDFPYLSAIEAETLCQPVLNLVNFLLEQGKLEFSFKHKDRLARFLIKGDPSLVQQVVTLLFQESEA